LKLDLPEQDRQELIAFLTSSEVEQAARELQAVKIPTKHFCCVWEEDLVDESFGGSVSTNFHPDQAEVIDERILRAYIHYLGSMAESRSDKGELDGN